MNEVEYIGANELIFNKDEDNNIFSGGFNINSIMFKSGMSPILSINEQIGGKNKVSDLFESLVIPNWALCYSMKGGEYKENEIESDEEIEDDLHEKLLDLVKENENKLKKIDKSKKTRKFIINSKKGGTKKKKI